MGVSALALIMGDNMKIFRKILWILTVIMLVINVILASNVILYEEFSVELPDWLDMLLMFLMAVNLMYGGGFIILALIFACVFMVCSELKKHEVQKNSGLLLTMLFVCGLLWSVQFGMGIMSV